MPHAPRAPAASASRSLRGPRVVRLRADGADHAALERALDLLRGRLPRSPLVARDGDEIVAVCSEGDEDMVARPRPRLLAPTGGALTGGAGEEAR